MRMTIFVTGSTGFIGRSLMAHLQTAGHQTRVHTGRINNPHDMRQQLEGVTAVIHLAGAETRGRHRLLNHVDVDGTARLLEECQRANIQHFIFLSRIGAEHNSVHKLTQAKGIIEQMIQQSGIPYTIIRSATAFGAGDRFTEIIASLALWSWPFIVLPGRGTTAVQPIWVEDVARCLATCIDHQPDLMNKTITIAGEERFRYYEFNQLILETLEKTRISLPIPLVLLRPINTLVFRWWFWPPVTPYFVDRFFIPDIAPLDSVLRTFGFRPARISTVITYLNRPGLRRRLFRR